MSNYKPLDALKLGLNILIDESCEGGKYCRWHEFPYKAENICSLEEKNEIEFNNINDVWSYIDLLIMESEQAKKTGSKFSNLENIAEQLPFFVCSNNMIDDRWQKDIARYIYCKDTNSQPYTGSYGDIPHIWRQKHFIIKQAMNIREQKLQKKLRDQNANK